MPESVNIGTVAAYAKLDITGLRAGILQSQQAMSGMVASMQKDLKQIEANTAQSLANSKKNIEAHSMAWQTAAKNISRDLLVMGAGITGALGLGVKAGADFEKTLNDVRANTLLSAADAKIMEQAVVNLGANSSAPLKDLALGFMHITNFGFEAANSQKILEEAMKSAISTGGNVEHTANILAAVMKEFSIKTEDAGKAMNTLHVASALGNMTLEQFNQAAGPMLAYAAGLGLKLPDVAAGMTALTRHGFDAAEAATQMRNAMAHIVSPSDKAKEALQALSKASGIDLVRDFSVAGLNMRTFGGVMADLRAAAKATEKDFGTLALETGLISKEGLQAFTEAEKKANAEMISIGTATKDLIPAMRGMIGTLVLAGRGFGDLQEAEEKLGMTMGGTLDRTTKDYERTTKTTAFQVATLRNNLELLGRDINKTLGPYIANLTADLGKLLKVFRDQTDAAKEGQIKFALWTGGILLAVGAVGSLVIKLNELKTAWIALGATGFLGKAGFLGLIAATAGGDTRYLGKTNAEIDAMRAEEFAKTHGDIGKPLNIDIDAKQAELRRLMPEFQSIFTRFPPSKSPLGKGTGTGSELSEDAKKEIENMKKTSDQMKVEMLRLAGERRAAADEVSKQEFNQTAKDFPQLRQKAHDLYIAQLREHARDEMAEEKKLAEERTKFRETLRERNFPQWEQLNARETAEALSGGAMVENMKAMAQFISGFSEMFRTIRTDVFGAQMRQGGDFFAMLNERMRAATGMRGPNEVVEDFTNTHEPELEPTAMKAPTSKALQEAKQRGEEAKQILIHSFEGAFEGMFTKGLKGFKQFFNSILEGFEQMLAQMAAKWAAEQIILQAVKLGAMFGFDDPKNDATAFRWGSDFGKHFTRGAYDGSKMVASTPASQSSQHLYFSFPGDIHVREEADINKIADRLAWQMKQRSRVRVGS